MKDNSYIYLKRKMSVYIFPSHKNQISWVLISANGKFLKILGVLIFVNRKFWRARKFWLNKFQPQRKKSKKRQLNKGTFGWYFCQDQQKCRSRCYIFLYSDLIPTRKTFVFGHFSRSVRPWDKDQNRVCLLTKHIYSH